MSRGRDLAGWLGAGAVTAGLFAGVAAAALRAPPAPWGEGAEQAIALEMSVGVVPMAQALPSEPPAVEVDAPEAPRMPAADDVPDPQWAAPAAHQGVARETVPLPEPPLQEQSPLVAEGVPLLPAPPPPLAREEPSLDLAQSPRPPARPERRQVEEVAPVEQAAARTAEVPKAAAKPAASAAQAEGSQSAAQPAQRRREAGGQDAARYGDLVMRQIAKQRRVKAPDRGVVIVGFEVGAEGGLRRVVVVSSSGSAALDQVALDHIRRAAPFPPPPKGAATRFSFEFEGR
jgi:periplasmic protein TonB